MGGPKGDLFAGILFSEYLLFGCISWGFPHLWTFGTKICGFPGYSPLHVQNFFRLLPRFGSSATQFLGFPRSSPPPMLIFQGLSTLCDLLQWNPWDFDGIFLCQCKLPSSRVDPPCCVKVCRSSMNVLLDYVFIVWPPRGTHLSMTGPVPRAYAHTMVPAEYGFVSKALLHVQK